MNPTAITNNNTHCVADAPEACAPTIEPKLAQLLEFTQQSQSTITPKEINAHLEQVQQRTAGRRAGPDSPHR